MLETAEECAGVIAGDAMDERSEAILRFQRARIAEGDTGRYMMSSAVRPPARMPHVAHGKRIPAPPQPKPGFFARLFGRK